MDTKKLRQKILDLAIHGKLVPQDPNDEPASVLLERIRAEKERLIAEGKIKRSKKSATSDTSHYENVPFEIPDGWCWCKINDIAFVTKLAGFEFTKYITDNLSKSEGIPLFKGKNVQGGEIIYEFESYIPEEISDELFRSQVTKKCLLTPYVGTLGNIGIHDKQGKYHLGSNVGKIEIFNTDSSIYIHEEYIKSFLMSSDGYKELTKHKKATAQESISIDAIRDIFIPVPPTSEQERIIDECNKLFSFVSTIEISESKITEYIIQAKSKILDLAIHGKLVPQDANDEPALDLLKRINPKAVASCDNPQYGKVPSSWVISTVGEVFTINPKTHVEDDTEAAFVPMTCVADGYNNTFEYECRKWGDIKKGFVHFQDNDVAVAKISPCLENRKSVVFHALPNGIGAGTTELNVFRCTEILPEYALFYFKSPMFIGSCAGTYNGVVGQQRVAKSFIQELPIGIPPYNEQLRIVSKVNELFSQLDMIEKSLQA